MTPQYRYSLRLFASSSRLGSLIRFLHSFLLILSPCRPHVRHPPRHTNARCRISSDDWSPVCVTAAASRYNPRPYDATPHGGIPRYCTRRGTPEHPSIVRALRGHPPGSPLVNTSSSLLVALPNVK